MNENENELKHNIQKENLEFNLPEFYKLVNKAILNKNVQSLYDLSKIFNRHYFKDLDI
jgi:hypothetical protein